MKLIQEMTRLYPIWNWVSYLSTIWKIGWLSYFWSFSMSFWTSFIPSIDTLDPWTLTRSGFHTKRTLFLFGVCRWAISAFLSQGHCFKSLKLLPFVSCERDPVVNLDVDLLSSSIWKYSVSSHSCWIDCFVISCRSTQFCFPSSYS